MSRWVLRVTVALLAGVLIVGVPAFFAAAVFGLPAGVGGILGIVGAVFGILGKELLATLNHV